MIPVINPDATISQLEDALDQINVQILASEDLVCYCESRMQHFTNVIALKPLANVFEKESRQLHSTLQSYYALRELLTNLIAQKKMSGSNPLRAGHNETII